MFILVFLGIFISLTSAQKIKIKKDVVLIDKTSAFTFVKLQSPLSKPFIWTIIKLNGDGHSTTGHFMSLVKELDLATIIGEELGSNRFCTANQKSYTMPHTGISYRVARNTFITTAESTSATRGILPDHLITQSIQDHLKNIDTVLEYTFELIEKEEN